MGALSPRIRMRTDPATILLAFCSASAVLLLSCSDIDYGKLLDAALGPEQKLPPIGTEITLSSDGRIAYALIPANGVLQRMDRYRFCAEFVYVGCDKP